ncbi:GNAT family N-acetyltransferase [Streptomyces sp. NPDC001922]|uniref:GNAT family N-acetyltransferase n=1 Tax=Streptomyces sp. NPDC001922 TaxID=3364624 RepID=UPI003696F9D7
METAREPRIEQYEQAAVPPELRDRIRELEEQAWPSADGHAEGPAHDPALRPLVLALVDRGTAVASLSVLTKELTHRGRSFVASGLSAVVTDRAERGRGHGHRLVTAAREVIRSSGADLGLFTCDPPLRGFYEKAGWRVLPGTTLVGGTPQAPFPSDRFDKVTLAAFFTPRSVRYAETFEQARIELYPGEIDKLW